MRSQIDLKRMRYILEVAKAEAITSAAHALAISQPALTRNIAEVEEELGVQLFHRMPRGIELTEDGKKFVARARQILSDVDLMVDEIREESGSPTGSLRVGFTPFGYVDYAREVFEKLAQTFERVSIEVHTGPARSIGPRLLHGELNVVVGSSSYLERWRDLEIRRIRQVKFAIVVRKDHPLSQITHLKEVDVLQYPVIMPASVEPMYADIAQRYLNNDMLPLKPQYVTDDFLLAQRLLKKTDAFYPLMAPEAMMQRLSERFLVLRDIVDVKPHYVAVAWSPHRTKTALTRWFEEQLCMHLAGAA